MNKLSEQIGNFLESKQFTKADYCRWVLPGVKELHGPIMIINGQQIATQSQKIPTSIVVESLEGGFVRDGVTGTKKRYNQICITTRQGDQESYCEECIYFGEFKLFEKMFKEMTTNILGNG